MSNLRLEAVDGRLHICVECHNSFMPIVGQWFVNEKDLPLCLSCAQRLDPTLFEHYVMHQPGIDYAHTMRFSNHRK